MAGGSSKGNVKQATKGDGKKKQPQAAASHGTKSKAQKPKQKRELMKATLLSGFLGSGKTTLMRHVLTNREGIRCAVIVNEISELNLDADILAGTKLIQSDDHLVEMGNGCICCTLREDLLNQLRELARSGNYDCVLIESSGIAEPMQVAETWFVTTNDAGEPMEPLQMVCPLDNCVTVVDASTFEDYMARVDSVSTVDESGKGAGGEGERDIASLFMDQLEFANVVVLNKIDLIPAPVREATVKRCTALIKTLAPSATVYPVQLSKVPLSAILNTGNFTLDFASGNKDWMEDIKSGIKHVPETLEYGVSSTMFRSDVPFHPQRMAAWVDQYLLLNELPVVYAYSNEEQEQAEKDAEADANDEDEEEKESPEEVAARLAARKADAAERRARRTARYGNLFRSKGHIYAGIADRVDRFGVWCQAGDIANLLPGNAWESMAALRGKNTPHTLLAFVGQDLNAANLQADLEALLMTPEEQAVLADQVEQYQAMLAAEEDEEDEEDDEEEA